MLLDEIRRKRDAIARLAQQYGARRLRVFDSVSRREERVDRDVDFLVDFPRGYDLFAQRLRLAEKLADLQGRTGTWQSYVATGLGKLIAVITGLAHPQGPV